jgi:hypothetical protein
MSLKKGRRRENVAASAHCSAQIGVAEYQSSNSKFSNCSISSLLLLETVPSPSVCLRLHAKRASNTSGVPASGSEHNHQQPKQGSRAPAEDVPGGLMSESSGEGIAYLVCRRMGCVHPDDQQDHSDHEQDESENSLHTHNWLHLRKRSSSSAHPFRFHPLLQTRIAIPDCCWCVDQHSPAGFLKMRIVPRQSQCTSGNAADE